MSRMIAVYHVQCAAASIAARAQAIAVEQSVEMPVAAISDRTVLRDIVGQVQDIREIAPSRFEVHIGISAATTGFEAGQLLNMLFGNTSLHEDVTLHDAEIPEDMAAHFGGPNIGISGLRTKCAAPGRALTCAALKPQGLAAQGLAALAGRLARGGLDFIKDDHGLADQAYSPFEERVRACADAVRHANEETGHRTRYVPNISGGLDEAAGQIARAVDEGVEAVLMEPMIIGVSNFHRLVREFPNMAFFAHPAMAGLRIAPALLLGKLFRLFGADVTIYPNYGGRFSYSPQTCRAIADAARKPWGETMAIGPRPPHPSPLPTSAPWRACLPELPSRQGGTAGRGRRTRVPLPPGRVDATATPSPLGEWAGVRGSRNQAKSINLDIKPCLPSPAGGMTVGRVPELLDFYGPDTMLLIGGSLLSAKENLTAEAALFAARVARHFEGSSHG